MADSRDAFRYISYVRLRWRFVVASCIAAAALAMAISLALPREYTAAARIVIEPPAGADPRAAMAVSPIYLESLKTYEQFAASDSLFQKAVERFHLRQVVGAKPIESLKKTVLEVGILRNTRILEIAARLPNARTAQALAQYLAEETVSLNRSLIHQSGHDVIDNVEQQEREARARLDASDREWSRILSAEPVEDLQSALTQAGELRSNLDQQIASAHLEIADTVDREKQASPSEREVLAKEQSSAQARLAELQKQLDAVNRDAAEKEKRLAERLARRDRIEAERKASQAALTATDARLREARNDLGYRGERLTIIDPGVVPERPSSPNLPLNVAAAILLGLVLPMVYLAIELSYREQRAGVRRSVYQGFTRDG